MPTAYRILPAMTTAGRHHRVCVATSRRPHPHILESGLARSPPLPIILCVYTSAHHFRWIRAYIVTMTDSPAVSTFSAQDVTDWVHLTLKYSYSVSGATREVPLEIVEYYEDGFEFNRRSVELIAEARYSGGTSWFPSGASAIAEVGTRALLGLHPRR